MSAARKPNPLKKFYSDYYDASGKRHRKTHATKPEAIAATVAGKTAAAVERAKRLQKLHEKVGKP
jgi:hypothetical protein